MKQALMVTALSLAIVGCAGVDKAEFDKLYTQADNEVKLASKAGYVWVHTEKHLKEAKEAMDAAMKANDGKTQRTEYDKAMKLANTALKEARTAQQQAKDNQKPDVKIPN